MVAGEVFVDFVFLFSLQMLEAVNSQMTVAGGFQGEGSSGQKNKESYLKPVYNIFKNINPCLCSSYSNKAQLSEARFQLLPLRKSPQAIIMREKVSATATI